MDTTTKQHIGATVVGIVIAGAGGYFLTQVLDEKPIPVKLVYVFAGMIALGTFFMLPTLFLSLVKTVIVVVPQLKWGGRKEDAPMAVAPPGTMPGDPVKPLPTESEAG